MKFLCMKNFRNIMPINSSNISLELAHRLTDVVNASWESGEMMQKVTPTTAALLKNLSCQRGCVFMP